jgi:hypothetical protein
MSCSEAGVEKAFSRIGLIFGDHRNPIQDDLIEALLVIRLDNVSTVPRSSSILDNVGLDFSARGGGLLSTTQSFCTESWIHSLTR